MILQTEQVYQIGDTVWYASNGRLLDGQVINVFKHQSEWIYVLEVDTMIDPVYEAHTWYTLSPDGKWPLNFLRKPVDDSL